MSKSLSSLTVFFPAHNEAGNIERVVRQALSACGPLVSDLEVIVVDDGSTDDTAQIVQNLVKEDPRVRLVRHPANRGYGGALKTGFAAAQKEFIFFTDSDGQFDIGEISKLIELVDQGDMVAGYRIKRSDPPHRLLNARLYRLLIRLLYGLKIRDIDCAFKLLRREILDYVSLSSEGALISAELLLRTRAAGFRIVEVGVHHYPREWGDSSGAKLKVILRMFAELFRFRGELASQRKRNV